MRVSAGFREFVLDQPAGAVDLQARAMFRRREAHSAGGPRLESIVCIPGCLPRVSLDVHRIGP
jgi:hypothetical protein